MSSVRRDITASIERLEMVENRLGVALSGLSAFFSRSDYDEGDTVMGVQVYGEVYANLESDSKCWIMVYIEAYDNAGELVGKDHVQIRTDEFFGFATFDAGLELFTDKISKVRVYPDVERPKYRY